MWSFGQGDGRRGAGEVERTGRRRRRRGQTWIGQNVVLLGAIALVLGLAGLAVGWKEHQRGRFGRLKAELRAAHTPPSPPAVPPPGGQDPVVLRRSQLAGDMGPEFLSATILPGLGSTVLQVTAFVPGHGEVKLLASPGVEEVAKAAAAGDGSEPRGVPNLSGGIEAPWAGTIFGAAGGRVDDVAATLAEWRGRRLVLPSETAGMASGGLLRGRAADEIRSDVMPDGGQLQTLYRAGSFDGHWISDTEVTTTILLSSRVLEFRIMARNVGKEVEPVGIGWAPRFVVPCGDRSQATLRLPVGLEMETRPGGGRGQPTGRLLPMDGAAYDFTGRMGARLPSAGMRETVVHLRPALLDLGPTVELRDPRSDFGLRVIAMTPMVRAIRVDAPAGAGYVEIAPQLNYDDPFGREWARDEDTGIAVLEPGQTIQWKVRVELFSMSASEGHAF